MATRYHMQFHIDKCISCDERTACVTIFITASHSSPMPSSEDLSPFQEGGVIWRNGVIASGPKGMDAVMQRVHHGGR